MRTPLSRFVLIVAAGLLLSSAAFAAEHSMLARVTVYWREEGCGQHACSNGARLQDGHCAVDPAKIPYGSKVIFPDRACEAIDSGPDVISRKATRRIARTAAQRNAVVIDRFFETKQAALSWAEAHPKFLMVRIVAPSAAASVAKVDANGNATPSAPAPKKTTAGRKSVASR
jgi:3D (Asp-Asp-Asp) domain-containing protein